MPRRSCCGSVSLIKGMLHIINIVVLLSGCAVFGVSLYLIIEHLHYACLLSSYDYAYGTYVLAIAGFLAIAGALLGCWGINVENRIVILFYTFLMAGVFLVEAIVGGFALHREYAIYDMLEENLNKTFLTSYGFDARRTDAIDRMQQEYKCCGAIRFEDWRASKWLRTNQTDDLLRPRSGHVVPDSCCTTPSENCGRRDHPSNIPYTGCIYEFAKSIQLNLSFLSAVGLGMCLIQFIGVIFSCCLYVKLSEPDE